MTNFRTASAIILASVLLVLASGCAKESDSTDISDSTDFSDGTDFSESADLSESTDFGDAPMQTIPSEIVFGSPAIGGNAILSQDTLDDFTAGLIIGNISRLPDNSEKNNYYYGRFIVVELKDNKREVTVKGILPKNPYVYSSEAGRPMRIDADCAADSVKLLSIEDNGKKTYVLKVEYAREDDKRIAAFASCDISGKENGGGGLQWYEIVDPDGSDKAGYECKVSSDFDYKGGNRFSDGLHEYEFDTENLRITVD